MEENCFISFDIKAIDYYITIPNKEHDICYSSLTGTAINQVPILRIWGSTPNGEKVCCHLHKIFPYFYLEYLASKDENITSFSMKLITSIEKAMEISFPKSKIKQYIFHIAVKRKF